MDVLLADDGFLDRRVEVVLEILDAFLDDILRSTRAGGDQDRLDSLEPLGLDLGDTVDQVGVRAERVGDLGKPPAIRAVLTAQDQDQVTPRASSRTAS